MLVKYYYLRDKTNAPKLTRCVIRNKDGEIAVGSALCSDLDFPNKKVGRKIAFHRALYALEVRENVLPIQRNLAQNILVEVGADAIDYSIKTIGNFDRDFKGIYNTIGQAKEVLNTFEKQLIGLET